MNNTSKKKSMQFLLLTFLITWLCFGTIIIGNLYEKLLYGTPIFMILFIVGGNGAPIAVYILLKRWNKTRKNSGFIKKFFGDRIKWRDISLVLFFLMVHFIVQIITGQYVLQIPIYFGILMIPMTIIGGGLEEIGWRGFFQPELEKSMSFHKSSIICALLWALWHLPLWFIQGTYQADINFGMFVLSVLGMSFMLAAVRKITDNILCCILLHSLINSFSNVIINDQGVMTIITMVLEIVLSMSIISIYARNIIKSGLEIE